MPRLGSRVQLAKPVQRREHVRRDHAGWALVAKPARCASFPDEMALVLRHIDFLLGVRRGWPSDHFQRSIWRSSCCRCRASSSELLSQLWARLRVAAKRSGAETGIVVTSSRGIVLHRLRGRTEATESDLRSGDRGCPGCHDRYRYRGTFSGFEPLPLRRHNSDMAVFQATGT